MLAGEASGKIQKCFEIPNGLPASTVEISTSFGETVGALEVVLLKLDGTNSIRREAPGCPFQVSQVTWDIVLGFI